MPVYGKKKKGPFNRLITSPFFLIVIIIFAGFMAKASWNISKKTGQGSEEVSIARSELNRLKIRQQSLAQSVAYLDTEVGLEDEIRSKYRVAKPGEAIAVIVDSGGGRGTATSTDASHGFWSRFISFFGLGK